MDFDDVRDNTLSTLSFLAGLAAGAGLMYLLDPDRGNRRRALVRDQMVHASRKAQWAANKKIRDAGNRARGSVSEVWARMREGEIPDDVLEERVLAQIGHVLSHPGGVFVTARDGHVTVTGPVLQGEADEIRTRLKKTRGVRSFDVNVEEHASKQGIPSLQGESRAERKERVG